MRLPLPTLLAALIACDAQAAGPAEQYIDAQLRAVQSLEAQLDNLATTADQSASRLLAGGNIYLAGEKGMVAELLGRAGGLCAAKLLSLDKPLPAVGGNDLVLLSDYGTPGKLKSALEKLRPSGALVIVFASAANPLLPRPPTANLRTIPADIPLKPKRLAVGTGDLLIPVAAPAIATAEWTYVAELLGACRRHRRQLAVYLSIFLDEGRHRYDRTKGLLFEPDLRPEPVARGQYARSFLRSVGQSLRAIRNEEAAPVAKAAGWLREAIAAHGKIVRNPQGHLPPIELGAGVDAGFFTETTRLTGEQGEKWIRANLHAGDVYLFLGYQQNEDAMAAAANALGVRTIFFTATPPGTQQSQSPRHLYINPHWPPTDACLELPGYDVRACPLSCILGMTCYYAICSETVK